jgi:hypothetical protein
MIESYSFGTVVIAGATYTSDVIVFPDHVLPNWWRREGHLLQLDDLAEALAVRPEVLIVGTGAHQRVQIAPAVIAHTRDAGIQLLAFDTRTACRTFNELLAQRHPVAALHLTC